MGLFLCKCGQIDEPDDYASVSPYDGETFLGMRHGQGVYYYKNGDIYDGEWRRGGKCGYGTYTFKDGTKIKGFFLNDEYIGDNPGYNFAEPQETNNDPAKPLDPIDKHSPRESAESRLRLAQERLEEGIRRREERSKRREEMRQKYNLTKSSRKYRQYSANDSKNNY